MSITTLKDKNKLIEVTDVLKSRMNSRKITLNLAQDRLNDGWSLEDATSLNPNFVTKYGGIYWCYAFPHETLYIKRDVFMRINIQKYRFPSQYYNNCSFKEILGDDFDYIVESNELTEYDLALDDNLRKERAEKIRIENEKRERPWLYDGTPQVHPRSKYAQYLMQTSIYPKAVR